LLGLALTLQLRARPTAGDELQAEDLDLVWEEIYGLEPAGAAADDLPRPATAPAPGGAVDPDRR
jgi:hypothetical protein